MRRFLLLACLLPLAFAAHAGATNACRVKPADLLGAWEAGSDGGPFEQLEFASDGNRNVFHSWLHERPDIVEGTWTLQACTLTIVDPADSTPFTLRVRITGRNRLELREKGAPATVYVRMKATP